MNRSSFVNATSAPATAIIRTLDGAHHLVPAWWVGEARRSIVSAARDAVQEEMRRSLICPPSVAAEAALDANKWLQALGAVVLR
jgi:hypothetical protein